MAIEAWADLFDASYAAHAVSLLVEDQRAQRLPGYQPTLQQPLRELLVDKLDEYVRDTGGVLEDGRIHLARTDVEAAIRLSDFARELATRVERREILGVDPSRLEQLWLAFIAQAAGPRVYHDALRHRRQQSRKGKLSGRARRRQSYIDDAAIAAIAKSRRREGVSDRNLTSETRHILLQRTGVAAAPKTIRESLRRSGVLKKGR